MLRRRHRPIHYRPRPRSSWWWLATILLGGLGVGAALHYWSEPFGGASVPSAPTRVATFTGRAEASGPTGLRIEPAALVLYGVDPPSGGIECPGGDCAAQARAAIGQIVGELEVHCVGRPVPDGRPAATCFLPDGTDIAAALVARGWALAAGETPLYRAEEDRARAASVGLWARASEAQATGELPPDDVPVAPPVGPRGYVPPDE